VSYRHLLVWTKGRRLAHLPPHDLDRQEVGTSDRRGPAPVGPDPGLLAVLPDQEVQTGGAWRPAKSRATSIWLWGRDGRPRCLTLNERFGLTGAVNLGGGPHPGIGKYAGLTPIIVPGATGFLDTNSPARWPRPWTP